jgi:hypothetical protein
MSLPHKACAKRSNYIKQACWDAMREKHPDEYNQIVNEAIRVFPEHAKPRYAGPEELVESLRRLYRDNVSMCLWEETNE